MKHLKQLLAAAMISGVGLAAPAQAHEKFVFGLGEGGVFIGVQKGVDKNVHKHGHKHSHEPYRKQHVHKKTYGHDHGHHYRHRDTLRPKQVRRILRRNGFSHISRPEYRDRRNAYVALAENRRGREVRVVIDAFSGDILRVRPIRSQRTHQSRYDDHRETRFKRWRDDD